MTDHFKNIYTHEANHYKRMVSREDMHGNLFSALLEIADPSNKSVIEFGAGTGRLTRLLSVMVNQIIACDIAPAMLHEAQKSLALTGMTNWHLSQSDNRAMPFAANSADVVIQGWSFAHTRAWSPDNWQTEIAKMIAEMKRLLKPGGTMILLETMGTGNKQPEAPMPELAELYAWWEVEYNLDYRWIRTDYQFESVEEADELTRFFFGDDLADSIVASGKTILPECTGIWWKTV
ncbi:MAG: class I SAM-dependent methyltransferase [Aggregatilineales bacterium]